MAAEQRRMDGRSRLGALQLSAATRLRPLAKASGLIAKAPAQRPGLVFVGLPRPDSCSEEVSRRTLIGTCRIGAFLCRSPGCHRSSSSLEVPRRTLSAALLAPRPWSLDPSWPAPIEPANLSRHQSVGDVGRFSSLGSQPHCDWRARTAVGTSNRLQRQHRRAQFFQKTLL